MKKYYLIIAILLLSILAIIIFFPPQKISSTLSAPTLTIQKSTGLYSYENTTNTFQTYFKDSPIKESSISFKTGNSQLSFYTPKQQIFGNLNSSTSVVKNNTITYQNIFTDTDLKYTISPKRLLEEFIVSTQPTALKLTRISQIAQTENIDKYETNSDGSISFLYQNQVKFIVPKPVLYELNHQENKNYGIEYQITKTINNSYQIDKVITPEGLAWLANLNRDYPIAIDLVIDNADTASNWVSSDATNTVVSQETTIKHEGTGSVKVQTVADDPLVNVDLMEYSSDSAAQAAYVTNVLSISGGTETVTGVYRVHTFRLNTVTSAINSGTVAALVVGGGGAGGNGTSGTINTRGGGGGGGGVTYNSSIGVSTGFLTIIVGAGGSNSNGGSSSFLSLTAAGGGKGGNGKADGNNGACGGGAGASNIAANTYTGGTGSTGYDGGQTRGIDSANESGSAGGGGMSSAGGDAYQVNTGGNGGNGISNSINGSSVYYGGGGGGSSTGTLYNAGIGGTGGGGKGCKTETIHADPGTDGRGGGGGGSCGPNATPPYNEGALGGNGVVIIRYPDTPLQCYSQDDTVYGGYTTQGGYSLKVEAKATNSLNKTLTRTIGSPINLSGKSAVYFDIRASRTGSNVKVGLHDSGGTTTEVTPNITSADTWQNVSINLSGVTNANKDAIDQIIITIVNADSDNTFYIDNMISSSSYLSQNDTITRTLSARNLSVATTLSFWIRSSVTGTKLRFQFGESSSSEQTYDITISSANTWEQKSWNISGISSTARDAVTKFAYKVIDSSSAITFYFDDLQTNNTSPYIPTLDSPDDNTTISLSDPTQLLIHTTDADLDYLQYFIKLCTDLAMSVGCSNFDQSSSQTGWSNQNVGTSAYSSGTTATYTIQYTLNPSSSYYWQAKAKDPGGLNSWTAFQATPYKFSTGSAPNMSGHCLLQKSPQNNSINITWLDLTSDEDGYAIQKKIDSGTFTAFTTVASGVTGVGDTSVTTNHTYQYRVAPYYTGPIYANWCNTPTLNLQTDSIKYEGILFQ